MKIAKKRLTLEQERNLHYLTGFNDALMIIQIADKLNSWDEALKRFDFEDLFFCSITKENMEKVRKIWEILTIGRAN